MIITCDSCGNKFNKFGAVIVSPPVTLPDGTCGKIVGKYHICPKCFEILRKFLKLVPIMV